jgi:hypothetical protein
VPQTSQSWRDPASRKRFYEAIDVYAEKLQSWQNYSQAKGLELLNFAQTVDREQLKQKIADQVLTRFLTT